MFSLILLGVIISVSSLSTGIDSNKQFCSQVTAKANQTLTITYVSSGFQEDQLEVKLFDPSKNLLATILKKKEYTHKQALKVTGLYEVCFKPLDKYYKLISFDFDFSEEDRGLVLAETMDQVAKDLKDAYRDMQKIAKNQHYQSDRETTHQSCKKNRQFYLLKVLDQTEKKLQWCSVAKMGVLILICISQIYMLTGFFKDKTFGPNV